MMNETRLQEADARTPRGCGKLSWQDHTNSDGPPGERVPVVRARVSRRRIRLATCCAAIFAGFFVIVGTVSAQEFHFARHDLDLRVDARWAGNAHGGYWPIRVRATNRRRARTITFRFLSEMEGVPTVERTLAFDQNATARFTLAVPMVGDGSYGEFQVLEHGKPLEGMGSSLSGPDADYEGSSRPALLVVAPGIVDCQPFENAVSATIGTSESDFGGSIPMYGYGGSRTEDHAIVRPEILPETWLGYTGLDIVAIPLETLASLSAADRGALLAWVHAGGTLAVYRVPSPADHGKLDELLGANRAGFTDDWARIDVSSRKPLPARPVFEGEAIPPEPPASSQAGDPWPTDAMSMRPLMLGRVVAFRNDPFPGTATDWGWFLHVVGKENTSWKARHGQVSRRGMTGFMDFIIPGVTSVPIYAFLVLITIFTIVIGPVNYIFCRKKKRMPLLVLTIPAIAIVTSLALFGYSMFAHGFGVKSRIRSITFLDQPLHTAVTTSRVALFAGMTPSGGLRFSRETAVYPVWPEQSMGFGRGRVNWTDMQAFESGWLKSRTRTQFQTRTHRAERERIDFSPGDSSLEAASGLTWDLAILIATDDDGTAYIVRDLESGERMSMATATDVDWGEFRQRMIEAESYELEHGSTIVDYPHDMRRYASRLMRGNDGLRFNSSSSREGNDLPPRAYIALLKENPEVDTGLEDTNERASLHILVGRY